MGITNTSTIPDIINNLEYGTFRIDTDGKLLYINETMLRILGIDKPDSVINTDFTTLVKTPSRFLSILNSNVFGSPFYIECTLYKADGAELFTRNRVRKIEENSGNQYFDCLAEATFEKGNLIHEERILNLAIDKSPNLLIITDLNGTITFCNRTTSIILGYPPESLVGRKFAELLYSIPNSPDFDTILEKSILCGEIIENIEVLLLSSNNEIRYFSTKLVPISDESGAIEGCLIINNNITEFRKIEKELAYTDIKYKTLFDSVNDAIILFNNGRIADCNAKAEALFGSSREELIGSDPTDFVPETQPDGSNSIEKIDEIYKTLLDGKPQFVEWRYLKKDGSFIDTEVNLSKIDGVEGFNTVAIIRNVTYKKQIESALKESKERYRLLVEISPDPIVIYDLKGNILTANHQTALLYGVSSVEELVRAAPNIVALIIDRDRSKAVENMKLMMVNNRSDRNRYTINSYDGRELDIEISASLLKDDYGNPSYIISIVRDITEQLKAENALKESKARNQALLDSIPDLIFLLDRDGNFLDFRPEEEQHSKMLFKPEEYIGKNIAELIPQVAGQAGEAIRSVLATGSPASFEYDLNFKGEMKSYEARMVPFGTDEIIAIIIDITDRKQTERLILESEQRLAGIIEFLPDPTFAIDINGTVIAWNRAIEEMTGVKKELVLNKPGHAYSKAFYKEDRPMLIDLIFSEDEKIIEKYDYVRKDGNIYTCEVYDSRFYDSSGAHLWGKAAPLLDMNGKLIGALEVIRDVTERRNIEDQIRLNYERVQVQLKLNQMTRSSLQEITDFVLEEAVRITRSEIGYLAFLNEDESVLTMHSWSKNAMKDCAVIDKPVHYDVDSTGLWGEAVRQRKPVITNNYAEPNPLKKGIPEGHIRINRHMNIPVFVNDHIVLVAGLGNKKDEYDETDVHQLTILMENMWRLIERRNAEEALRKSEEQFRFIAENTNDIIWIMNENFRTTYMSHSVEKHLGYKPEEYIRMPLLERLPEESSAFMVQFIDEKLKKADAEPSFNSAVFELKHRHKNGAILWGEISVNFTRAPDGKINGVIGVTRNIDDRKKAEEALRLSEEKYRSIVKNIPVIIQEYDNKGYYLLSEGKGMELLGFRQEDLLGKHFEEVLAGNNDLLEAIRQALNLEIVYSISTLDNKIFETYYNPVLGNKGDLKSLIAVSIDITDRKLQEEELRSKNEELERFTYTVSHDLKSPLVTIQSFLGFLLEDIKNNDIENIRKDIGFVNKAAERMSRLLQELLELSRIGRKVNPPKEIPLKEIAKESTDLIAGRLKARNVEVEMPEENIILYGDKARLTEVFLNLLDNAVKFLGDQPDPKIAIEVENTGINIVISVVDNGIGIDPKYNEKIFGLFEKLKADSEGTGIGLALVKRIIETHNGKIWAESEGMGKGSAFRFILPNTKIL